jgi:hypothetical protein
MLSAAPGNTLPKVNAAAMRSKQVDVVVKLPFDHLLKPSHPKPPDLEDDPRRPPDPLLAITSE